MPLGVAIRNRYALCCLLLMLAPLGISLPTLLNAARADDAQGPAKLGLLHIEGEMPKLYAGGTIVLSDVRPPPGRPPIVR